MQINRLTLLVFIGEQGHQFKNYMWTVDPDYQLGSLNILNLVIKALLAYKIEY